MYMLREVDGTGGNWLHDMAKYIDLSLCEITAQMAFDDGLVDKESIIQAWKVDEEGDIAETSADQEWSSDDFKNK